MLKSDDGRIWIWDREERSNGPVSIDTESGWRTWMIRIEGSLKYYVRTRRLKEYAHEFED
jgi:hypothetical protein